MDTVAESDQDEPLPELGHAVAERVHHPFLHPVPERLQFVDHGPENEHLPVQGHVRHILHEHRRGPGNLHDLEK